MENGELKKELIEATAKLREHGWDGADIGVMVNVRKLLEGIDFEWPESMPTYFEFDLVSIEWLDGAPGGSSAPTIVLE